MSALPWPTHPAAERFDLLADVDLRALADDIAAHGLHEPVWLYDDPDRGVVLLDGRNRIRACALAGVDVTSHVRWYRGVRPWHFVFSENLHRRHLSAARKIATTLGALPELAAEDQADADTRARAEQDAHRRRAEAPGRRGAAARAAAAADAEEEGKETITRVGTDAHSGDLLDPESVSPHRARDDIAEVAGVSGRSVAQYLRVQEQAPDLIAKVDADEISLNRAERIIRDRVAEAARVAQARAEAAAYPELLRVDIRHGDFREVLADLTDVDAVITDPPYPAEYLPLLADLAAWADKVLAPDGVLVVLIGQTHLPEVYRLLSGYRPYRWTGCYFTPGPGYVSHPRKVQSNWKPLLIYGGGPRFTDVVSSEGSDAAAKSHHKWGQDYAAFHTIIERFTARGQTVADPFMGSGTTVLAAHALGRHVIGADIDEQSVAIARERMR